MSFSAAKHLLTRMQQEGMEEGDAEAADLATLECLVGKHNISSGILAPLAPDTATSSAEK